jgi:AraC-like DNA-binding protein
MSNYSSASASLMAMFIEYLQSSGCDFNSLNKIAGQDLEDYTDQSPKIKKDIVSHLFHQASIELNDPAMGLHISEYIADRSEGLLVDVILSAKDLNEALQVMIRLSGLMVDSASITIDYDSHFGYLKISALQPDQITHHQLECMVGSISFFIKRVIGNEANKLEYYFPYQCQSNEKEYENIIGSPCVFMQKNLCVKIPLALLYKTSKNKNNSAHQVNCLAMQEQLDKIKQQENLIKDIKVIIKEQLCEQGSSQQNAANKMNISVRNLQRKLKTAGMSYQKILDSVRKDEALKHMADENITLHEIAFLVGYTETSAFFKAFKRWTGYTPGEYRTNIFSLDTQPG